MALAVANTSTDDPAYAPESPQTTPSPQAPGRRADGHAEDRTADHRHHHGVRNANIISQVSDIGVMAVGAAMVIIIGGIDLSVGSTLALSMMMMAWVYKIQGIPFRPPSSSACWSARWSASSTGCSRPTPASSRSWPRSRRCRRVRASRCSSPTATRSGSSLTGSRT